MKEIFEYLKNNQVVFAAVIVVVGFFLFKFIQYSGCSPQFSKDFWRGFNMCMAIDLQT